MLIRLHDVNILITMNVLIKITLLSIVTFLKISRLRLPRRMFRDFGKGGKHPPWTVKVAPFAGKVTSCTEDVLRYCIRC